MASKELLNGRPGITLSSASVLNIGSWKDFTDLKVVQHFNNLFSTSPTDASSFRIDRKVRLHKSRNRDASASNEFLFDGVGRQQDTTLWVFIFGPALEEACAI
jgi:hypothetical protein